MRTRELFESTSFESTISVIVVDLGARLGQLYTDLKLAADEYYPGINVDEDPDRFGLRAGSLTGKWMSEYWVSEKRTGNLSGQLNDLGKYRPNQTPELRDFLKNPRLRFTYKPGFKLISRGKEGEEKNKYGEQIPPLPSLPSVLIATGNRLIRAGDKINGEKLVSFARNWQRMDADFMDHIAAYQSNSAPADSEKKHPKPINVPKSNTKATQASAAQDMLTDLLNQLPKEFRKKVINDMGRTKTLQNAFSVITSNLTKLPKDQANKIRSILG